MRWIYGDRGGEWKRETNRNRFMEEIQYTIIIMIDFNVNLHGNTLLKYREIFGATDWIERAFVFSISIGATLTFTQKTNRNIFTYFAGNFHSTWSQRAHYCTLYINATVCVCVCVCQPAISAEANQIIMFMFSVDSV